eukprot:scaffold60802_cov64-Phaeocystis_antarctica.AAC.6
MYYRIRGTDSYPPRVLKYHKNRQPGSCRVKFTPLCPWNGMLQTRVAESRFDNQFQSRVPGLAAEYVS